MLYSAPARTRTGWFPTILVAGLLVVAAALGYPLLASSSSTAASPIGVLSREHPGGPGEADGVVPDGTTVFDDEVDIGPVDATAWLSKHGAKYGLCQIYGNEPWHFELRPTAIDHGCPRMYADPTHDPRMGGHQ